MKKIAICILVCLFAAPVITSAWSKKGHQIVVAIAKRHLSDKAKAGIAAIYPGDIVDEASWMDYHRKDDGLKHTSSYHSYAAYADCTYDPNIRAPKGDALRGITIADYNFRHPENTNDSLKLLSLRMLIHFVGDFHCPTHVSFPDISMKGDWYLDSEKKGNFHHVYDAMPTEFFSGISAEKAAQTLDKGISEAQVAEWVKGDFIDWLNRASKLNRGIYEFNPTSPERQDKQLNPKTYELSRPIVEEQLLAAGYQLAHLLNSYFE